jgi:hypothetical protein
MPVIPALRRQSQENHELEASLGYTARPSLKNKQTWLYSNKTSLLNMEM